MTDAPKRRGRPPKVWTGPTDAAMLGAAPGFAPSRPTQCLRIKAGALQQAWQHATGTQWRQVPVVPADAPDWEDA